MRFRVVYVVNFNIMSVCVNRMGLTPEVDINVFGTGKVRAEDRSRPSRDRGGVIHTLPSSIVLTASQHPFF